MIRHFCGRLFLFFFKWLITIISKGFSFLSAGAFASFGKKSVLMLPVTLSGEERIQIGDEVYIGANSWLQVLADGDNIATAISIGSGTSMAGACVISAVRRVVFEDNVLIARNVYISDHIHEYKKIHLPIKDQGIAKIAPVLIRRGAWIGQNVVICPGVTVGIGSVVAANSVVNKDVPDFCLAVGAPAHIVKKFCR